MNPIEPLPTKIYTPDSAISDPQRLAREMLRDLVNSRQLAWRLAVRDIRAQHRQSFLGFAWALLVPLGHAAVWILIAGSGLLTVGQTAMPYPTFVLVGTMLWAIFADAVNAPLMTVGAARDMLVRINFPREALIVSGVIQVAFNAAIKLAIIVVILLAAGIPLHWGSLWAIGGVALLILCGTCAGMVLLPFGLLYTDVLRALPFLMQALMYLTPVFYPIPNSGAARDILMLNPLTGTIQAIRDVLTGAPPVLDPGLLATAGIALVLIVGLWVVYRLAIPIIIERMSS